MEMAEQRPFRIDEFSGFLLYLQTIEWKDPWLIALICFHITVTLTSVLTRNHGNFQVVLFLVLLLLVYFSESLNEIAAKNWSIFSRQQYFDSNGLFMSIVFCAPILLNCMILVASWLYQSSQLMAQLKRAQLQNKIRAEERRKEGLSGSVDGASNVRRRPTSALLQPSMDATGIQAPSDKN